jgi:hypothetical protein
MCMLRAILIRISNNDSKPCSIPKYDSTYAGQRRVLWQNMREEPVLYVSGFLHLDLFLDMFLQNIGMRQ